MIAGKTGAVMTAGDVEMLFLSFLLEDGEMDLDLLAGKAVDRLLLLGKTLVKDGTALTNRETMLPYARELAEQFTNKTLPRWRTLGVL
jgi:hypothetical protein